MNTLKHFSLLLCLFAITGSCRKNTDKQEVIDWTKWQEETKQAETAKIPTVKNLLFKHYY